MMVESATKPVEKFTAEAARAGSVVYKAKNAKEVSDYINDLAKKHNIKTIVKSKSLLANQIKLREELEKQGLNVKETDITEWIAQISRENTDQAPKNIEQITEALSKVASDTLKYDAENLSDVIRRTLREYYIKAGIGVSEAEVAVAETGTCIMISDEGNDRLVSLLPDLHVTLIDQRKMVTTWEEAIDKLEGLFKENGEWRMPSFITYLTGRNTTGDIPGAIRARAQGPEEEHIIIVDIV